jgi:hypothetical protein
MTPVWERAGPLVLSLLAAPSGRPAREAGQSAERAGSDLTLTGADR